MAAPSIDGAISRSAVKVYITINGVAVGRVQTITESVNNNVQRLMEFGTQFAVELKKGITTYDFQIARLFTRSDAFEAIKLGQVFGLEILDRSNIADFSTDPLVAGGNTEVLEMFTSCALNTWTRTYNSGQATVAENASVMAIGAGIVSINDS